MSFVEDAVQGVRKARTETDLIEAYKEFVHVGEKYNLSHEALTAFGGSMMLAAIIAFAKQKEATVTEASAAAFQIISDLTTNPAAMIKLWTTS